MPSIIVFGATGFLGAPITRAIVEAHPDWNVTAYARGTQGADSLKHDLGVKRVEIGDFNEFDKIKALSKEHDIAVNAGNSFTDAPISAIVAGLRERESKGKLLHISGAGNFLDFGTTGAFNLESKVWNDDSEDDIKLINKEMFNGASDVVALEAGKDGAVETYVVCTPVTYGGAAVKSKGIGVGYNLITGNAKPLGYVPYIGDGSAVLSTAHVLDVVPFMLKILEIAASEPAQGSVYSRWYNVETQRVTWKDFATELAKVMYEKGVFKSAEPKSVPLEEAGEGEVKYLVAGNMLMSTKRSARLGFRPTQPSILVQVHEDLKDAAL